MQNLAALMQCHKGFSHVVSRHQRIGAMDQEQIKAIGVEMAQRVFSALQDMVFIGDVVANLMLRPGAGSNTAFGHNLQLVAQSGCQFQRLAKCRFTLVVTVDVGMVNGGNAKPQMVLNKRDALLR